MFVQIVQCESTLGSCSARWDSPSEGPAVTEVQVGGVPLWNDGLALLPGDIIRGVAHCQLGVQKLWKQAHSTRY